VSRTRAPLAQDALWLSLPPSPPPPPTTTQTRPRAPAPKTVLHLCCAKSPAKCDRQVWWCIGGAEGGGGQLKRRARERGLNFSNCVHETILMPKRNWPLSIANPIYLLGEESLASTVFFCFASQRRACPGWPCSCTHQIWPHSVILVHVSCILTQRTAR